MRSACLLTVISLIFFLSVNYEKLCFEMVQAASSILNGGEQIILLQQLMADILLSKSFQDGKSKS